MFWCRRATECNERFDADISSARESAERDVAESSGDILRHFDSK